MVAETSRQSGQEPPQWRPRDLKRLEHLSDAKQAELQELVRANMAEAAKAEKRRQELAAGRKPYEEGAKDYSDYLEGLPEKVRDQVERRRVDL